MLRNFLTYALRIFLICACLAFTPFVLAQETSLTEFQLQTLDVAQLLEAETLPHDSDVQKKNASNIRNTPELEHKFSRLAILEGFDGTLDNSFLINVKAYQGRANSFGSPSDKEVAELFTELSKIYFPYETDDKKGSLEALDFLDQFHLSENWEAAHISVALSAVIYSYLNRFPEALEAARDSYDLVQNSESFEGKVALLYTQATTVYLHAKLKNPEMMISSIPGLVNSFNDIGAPVPTANFYNNMLYALRAENNPDFVRPLVQGFLRVGAIRPPAINGLIEKQAAFNFIRIEDFQEALAVTRSGLARVDHPLLLGSLRAYEIQSLAGLGKAKEASEKLEQLDAMINASPPTVMVPEVEILKARALIAKARGDAQGAYTYLQAAKEDTLQSLLKSNNNDTATLLANLENDKIRLAEREAAQRALFDMEQQALYQRVKSTQRGMAIFLLLAIAAILTAAFMAYRSRTATKLATAAEAALAGEQAKSQFLAVISHELRTPLNGIIGIADLLSRTAPSLDLRRKIGIINNSGQDLLRLVEQILDMSRIDADEMQVFPETTDVRDVIESIEMLWRPTIEEKGVIFTSHVDSSVPEQLTLDPLRLRQCINNLVSNASKFTKDGRVHMHVTAEPVVGDSKNRLTVIVADTGMGIRKDVQDNLFKPFVQADSSITRQYGGSGLGLAITRSLARMMGGDLLVTSRVGAGSEFTLTILADASSDVELLDTMDALFSEDEIFAETAHAEQASFAVPRNEQRADSEEMTRTNINEESNASGTDELMDIVLDNGTAPTKALAVEPELLNAADMDSLEHVRILIVEDVPSNQDVMKIFLEPEGCVISCADNGMEALAALRSQDFDVILMDIRMPEMDGIEATRLIRSEGGRNSDVPIIALTADATAETNAQCMGAGANIFLTKPIIATELFDSIRFVRRQAANRAQQKATARLRKRA